jgi:hypothetical protein
MCATIPRLEDLLRIALFKGWGHGSSGRALTPALQKINKLHKQMEEEVSGDKPSPGLYFTEDIGSPECQPCNREVGTAGA